jgi:translation initiation factor IF-2
MALEPSRTYHANQAIQVSDLISVKFADRRFGTSTPRIVRVSEPDGPSTDGGRKARQPILLVPEQGEGNTVVCGFLDVTKRSAELRAYLVLSQQYQQRFGVPLDLSKGEYDRLLTEMQEFLKAQGIEVRLSTAGASRAAQAATAQASPSAPNPTVTVILAIGIGIVIGFVTCYAIMVARIFG